MSSIKREFLYSIVRKPFFYFKGRYLFILAHMRSYSSLLSHILGSHPEICGYFETRLSYVGLKDFLRLRYCLRDCDRRNFKYFLDKILHNKHIIADKYLKKGNIKFIFLLRSPVDTVPSIVNMNRGKGLDMSYAKAAEYYMARLDRLNYYWGNIDSKNKIFLKSEDILENTDNFLKRVQEFLELEDSLKKEYNIFEKTAKKGRGDTSDNIKKGIIVKKKNVYEFEAEAELRERLWKKYEFIVDNFARG